MGGIAILLAVTVAYALLARRLDRFSISAPIVFVFAGLVLGPDGAGLLDLSPDSHVVLAFPRSPSPPSCSPTQRP